MKFGFGTKYLIFFDDNWSEDEVTHRWAVGKNANFLILNTYKYTKKVDISFELHVFRRQRIKISNSKYTKEFFFIFKKNKIIRMNNVVLQNGYNKITIESNVEPSFPKNEGEDRRLTFSISNIVLYDYYEQSIESTDLYMKIRKISKEENIQDLFYFLRYVLETRENNIELDNMIIRNLIDLMLSELGPKLRSTFPDLYPLCLAMDLVILSDGSVTTCDQDPFGNNKFGSVYKEDFNKILEHYRNIIDNDRYECANCRNCIKSQPEFVKIIRDGENARRFSQKYIHFPDSIYVEPTSMCNYQCDDCPATDKNNPHTKIDFDIIFEKLRTHIRCFKTLCLFNYGEPLLHTGICKFVERCRSESPDLYILFSTNGMLLNSKYAKSFIQSKVNRICISVHGGPGTDNLRKYSHQGDYDKVLLNVKNLLELRKSLGTDYPKILLRAILFDWNDSDESMDQFREDARKLGLVNNDSDGDGYEWILDSAGLKNPRASKKYFVDSPNYKKLIDNKETEFFTYNWKPRECCQAQNPYNR